MAKEIMCMWRCNGVIISIEKAGIIYLPQLAVDLSISQMYKAGEIMSSGNVI